MLSMTQGFDLSPNSELSLIGNTIFSEKPKQPIATNSAIRYHQNSPKDFSSYDLPPKTREIPNRRMSCHHRQRSIYIPSEINIESIMSYSREAAVHVRNPSDTDSVIYQGPGDSLNNSARQDYAESKTELQLSVVETASGSILSIEKSHISGKNESIQSLGQHSVAVYCRYCREDVHTVVDFNECYRSKILNAISNIISCCNYPKWIAEYRVHKCPKCSLVLGKSR